MAVQGREADAEMAGIGLGKLWNVVSDFAAVVGGKIRVAGGQEPLQRRRQFITGQTRSGRLAERM